MHAEFVASKSDLLVCSVELVFDATDGDNIFISGMKFVGIVMWRSSAGDLYVTFPGRAEGSEKSFFDYLRPVDGDVTRTDELKLWIVEEFKKKGITR